MDRALVPGVPVSKESAVTFLLNKGVSGVTRYERTIFNVDAYEDTADLFICGDYWVKTALKEVLEWYKEGYTTPEGEVVYGVSLDLDTGEPLDVYRVSAAGISKVRPDGGITTTLNIGYELLPPDVQEKLKEFPFKDSIAVYSEKPYGRFIEYKRAW